MQLWSLPRSTRSGRPRAKRTCHIWRRRGGGGGVGWDGEEGQEEQLDCIKYTGDRVQKRGGAQEIGYRREVGHRR